ncbi:hypothetical protein [Actinobaculum sp. 313]|uniref:hypothetical protein n=1 Tax=Actinobaculum sp. 313 TaxID=2495645 RepID=UPI000D5288E4|nr:hypothetical protein [Actinobaculum sp. 313]AWE43104.1 hypothetical protein DDD63_10535 [Actinobaculum sp. 313]
MTFSAWSQPAGPYHRSREVYYVPFDGSSIRTITHVDGNIPFVGAVLDDWEVSVQLPDVEPTNFGEALVVALSPEGEAVHLGWGSANSLNLCDGYAYWWTDLPGPDVERLRSNGYEGPTLMRWKPGLQNVEVVTTTIPERAAGGTVCNNGYLNYGVISFDEGDVVADTFAVAPEN